MPHTLSVVQTIPVRFSPRCFNSSPMFALDTLLHRVCDVEEKKGEKIQYFPSFVVDVCDFYNIPAHISTIFIRKSSRLLYFALKNSADAYAFISLFLDHNRFWLRKTFLILIHRLSLFVFLSSLFTISFHSYFCLFLSPMCFFSQRSGNNSRKQHKLQSIFYATTIHHRKAFTKSQFEYNCVCVFAIRLQSG